MNMVIGGAYQGKLNYAKETFQIPDGWVDGAFCTLEDLAQCRGVYDFHLLIRRLWRRTGGGPPGAGRQRKKIRKSVL